MLKSTISNGSHNLHAKASMYGARDTLYSDFESQQEEWSEDFSPLDGRNDAHHGLGGRRRWGRVATYGADGRVQAHLRTRADKVGSLWRRD